MEVTVQGRFGIHDGNFRLVEMDENMTEKDWYHDMRMFVIQ